MSSIPDLVIPKTLNMVVTAALLDGQDCGVSITPDSLVSAINGSVVLVTYPGNSCDITEKLLKAV